MKACIIHSLLALAFLAGVNRVAAQGTTAFTYQGQLRDGGTNANGSYMMVFALYDAVTNGNQIGTAITNSLTLANGLFSVNLDFGAGAFNGSARWLDITVSNGVAQTLSPRVQVLPTPYSLYASTAGSVINTNGSVTAGTITATNLVLGGGGTSWDFSINSSGGLTLAYGDPIVAVLADTNGILSGNGGGLTNVSAVPRIQAFRSSDTFTVPANVTRIMVEMWGAGGGGGIGFHQDAKYDDLGNLIQPEIDNGGGGGGAGAYTMNVFTVSPGSSYSVTVPSSTVGGQSGQTAASFSGNSILMSAGSGSKGGDATADGVGVGGIKGTATGGLFQAGDNGQSGGQYNGGQGGGVWRGSPGSYYGGPAISGPGGGGSGGDPRNSGFGGNSGSVMIYY